MPFRKPPLYPAELRGLTLWSLQNQSNSLHFAHEIPTTTDSADWRLKAHGGGEGKSLSPPSSGFGRDAEEKPAESGADEGEPCADHSPLDELPGFIGEDVGEQPPDFHRDSQKSGQESDNDQDDKPRRDKHRHPRPTFARQAQASLLNGGEALLFWWRNEAEHAAPTGTWLPLRLSKDAARLVKSQCRDVTDYVCCTESLTSFVGGGVPEFRDSTRSLQVLLGESEGDADASGRSRRRVDRHSSSSRRAGDAVQFLVARQAQASLLSGGAV